MNEIPDTIYNVSNSHFSIARYAGSCVINGKTYVYFPYEDKLVSEEKLKRDKKEAKAKKPKRPEYLDDFLEGLKPEFPIDKKDDLI